MKRIFEYSTSFIIGIIAYLFWAFPFRSALNYHEEFQLFLTDSEYFLTHLYQRGGIAVYISEFLVQFYNNYWIGALIIAIEFVLIQKLSLFILQNINATWKEKHYYLLSALSLIPLALLWIVLGDINVMHSLIVAVIIALSLIYVLLRTVRKRIYRIIGIIVATILYIGLAGTSHYRIPNIILTLPNIYNAKTYELLDYDMMVRANRWDKIIQKAERQQPDLPMSVCATNLALGMTNQLGDRAGNFFQNGTEGLIPPFVKEPFISLTTAEVYFQLGLVNTAQRFYFEAMEAAPNYAKSCRCIRRLAETNLINGQYVVARKYLNLLKKTFFYKKWAQRTLDMIDKGEDAINNHPLYGRTRKMMLDKDFFFSEAEIDKICGWLLMHNHDNVLAMQYMLMFPLLENNYNKFAQYMYLLKKEVPNSQELASFTKYLRRK